MAYNRKKKPPAESPPEKPKVDEAASGWWMPLNPEDMEDYSAIFAEQGKTIDKAFVSVKNEIIDGKIANTKIRRRFYLSRAGAHCYVVDEDTCIIGPGVPGDR